MDLDSVVQFIERQEELGSREAHDQEIAQLRREVVELRASVAQLGKRVTSLEVAPPAPPEAPPSLPNNSSKTGAVDAIGGAQEEDELPPSAVHRKSRSKLSTEWRGNSMSVHFNADEEAGAVGIPRTNTATSDVTTTSKMPSGMLDRRRSYDDTQYYTFRDSLWDAVLFIFTEPMGIGGSIFVLLLAAGCAAMQLGFVAIVMTNFTNSNFNNDSLRNFRAWRLSVAHDVNHLDMVSFTSLASRVCQATEADGLNVGVRQAIALEAINRYLPQDDERVIAAFGGLQGQLMCCLAVMVWLMSVTKELRAILNLRNALQAVFGRGLEPHSILVQKGYMWSFDRMSKVRLLLAVLLVVYRVALAIALGAAGILYLVHTIDMTELLLNAVALELVLVVDELLYEALAPAQTWSFLHSLRPVAITSGYRWQGLDCRVVSFTGVIVATMFITTWFPLSDEVARLREARDILCDGKLDFVFTRSTMPPYLQYAESSPFTNDIEGFASDTIEKIIRNTSADEVAFIKVPALRGSAWSLELMNGWDVAEANRRYGQGCIDFNIRGQTGFNPNLTAQAVQYTVNNQSLDSCSGLHQFCDLDDIRGTYARQLCPITCGCHRPDSGLLLDDFTSGCPPQCRTGAAYQQVLANAPCEDQTLEELMADEDFLASTRAYSKLLINWPTPVHPLLQAIPASLLQYGCGAVPRMLGIDIDLCNMEEGLAIRPLRFRCPRACNCTAGTSLCPLSC